jgi:hypothetical protein
VTGRVNVAIHNDESKSAQLAAGEDRPLELMGISKDATDTNYNAAIASINKIVTSQLPGAKFKIATASSRSVTLEQEFERPLVIGYIGFDMPILKGGRLGAPISTLDQLTGGKTIEARSSVSVYHLAALSHMYQALNEIQGDEAGRLRAELDKLGRLLPKNYPFSLYEEDPSQREPEIVAGDKIEDRSFPGVLDYLENARTTIETLEEYIPKAPRDTDEQRKAASQLEQELLSARTALKEIGNRLSLEPALMEAIDFVFLGA